MAPLKTANHEALLATTSAGILVASISARPLNWGTYQLRLAKECFTVILATSNNFTCSDVDFQFHDISANDVEMLEYKHTSNAQGHSPVCNQGRILELT